MGIRILNLTIMKVQLIILLNEKHREKENRSESNFTTQLQRVPNIGEYFEYTSGGKVFYYGEVTKVETFKDDCQNEEKIFVTIREFD